MEPRAYRFVLAFLLAPGTEWCDTTTVEKKSFPRVFSPWTIVIQTLGTILNVTRI